MLPLGHSFGLKHPIQRAVFALGGRDLLHVHRLPNKKRPGAFGATRSLLVQSKAF